MSVLSSALRVEVDPEAPPLVVPPGATEFRAGGRRYYLFLSMADMETLQREWGFVAEPTDTVAELRRKNELFYARMNGAGPTADHVTLVRIGLTRWAQEQARGRVLTQAQVLKVLDELETPAGEEPLAPYLRLQRLVVRFLANIFGVVDLTIGQAEVASGPKAGSREGSIPSGS